MSFWGTQRLKDALSDVVPTGDPCRIEQAAYALSLGPEVFLSGHAGKMHLAEGAQVAIPPGRIAVLLTEEMVSIPANALGFISLKSQAKLPGLINVSGFHVDPGYVGRLIFTVYNAGTETAMFQRGDPMFLLWLADLTLPADRYSKEGYKTIPSQITTRLTDAGASPPQLAERLEKLQHKVDSLWSATWIINAGIFVALMIALFTIWLSGTRTVAVRIDSVVPHAMETITPTLSHEAYRDPNSQHSPTGSGEGTSN